ncbi:hypothetical protein JOL62DRAFT_586044 [Phyllosticta paracitricarpa]|uniref:Secreted protein n=1 Tax=Phyllosticta paracitricarpa TaxID=2016321 RepID=A0ABR1MV25_9PEZI
MGDGNEASTFICLLACLLACFLSFRNETWKARASETASQHENHRTRTCKCTCTCTWAGKRREGQKKKKKKKKGQEAGGRKTRRVDEKFPGGFRDARARWVRAASRRQRREDAMDRLGPSDFPPSSGFVSTLVGEKRPRATDVGTGVLETRLTSMLAGCTDGLRRLHPCWRSRDVRSLVDSGSLKSTSKSSRRPCRRPNDAAPAITLVQFVLRPASPSLCLEISSVD